MHKCSLKYVLRLRSCLLTNSITRRMFGTSSLQSCSVFFSFYSCLLKTLHLPGLQFLNLLFRYMDAATGCAQVILRNILFLLDLWIRALFVTIVLLSSCILNRNISKAHTLSSLGCLHAVRKRSSDASLVLLNFMSAEGPISSSSIRGVF